MKMKRNWTNSIFVFSHWLRVFIFYADFIRFSLGRKLVFGKTVYMGRT